MRKDSKFKMIFEEISYSIKSEELVLFIGSGLSTAAGYRNWEQLLEPAYKFLSLDKEQAKKEDLVKIAQYYTTKRNNRGSLITYIKKEYSRKVLPHKSHELISQLPVKIIWTTNYDKLLENSIRKKNPEAKVNVVKNDSDIVTWVPADKTIYKMHGDVDSEPIDIVITKDDYELFQTRKPLIWKTLEVHLNSFRFLFLGFGFRDPNMDHVLGMVRAMNKYKETLKTHYVITFKPKRDKQETRKDYEHRNKIHQLWIEDLKRYGIEGINFDDYSEITTFLENLTKSSLK